MVTEKSLCSMFLVIVLAFRVLGKAEETHQVRRKDFPPGFVFGAGTSAYQVEGATMEDGRSPTIWDTFTHAGKVVDKSTGDIASDGYHKYKEDVKLMSEMGLDAYRFSISWSRLIPSGRGAINPKGLQYYNNLIDELISHGIQPHATLYHMDLPQILEDEYGGWLSPKIVDDFKAYANVTFREFGDRVAHWTTINEPNILTIASYDIGMLPPQRCSYPFGFNCTVGNSSVEPYIAAHNVLLAHAAAATLYKEKYQAKQNGWIGLNVFAFGLIPLTNSTEDVSATQRAQDFYHGWFVHPLVFGDYPDSMKKNAGSRIPSFTKQQSRQVKGSFDFLGLNHYTTVYIEDDSGGPKKDRRDYLTDIFAKIKVHKDDTPGSQFPYSALPVVPSGLQKTLEYFKQAFGNPPIYVQENGYGLPHNVTLNDTTRADYLNAYIGSLLTAVRNGSDTRGYFVWSFLDVFELLSGYQSRFGLYYVDFESKDLTRHPKFSAHWYSNFLKRGGLNMSKYVSKELHFVQ